MATEIGDGHLRRLILAKMMFVHGLYHSGLGDQMSRMVSMHHFDNANEIVLRLLADISNEPYDENNFNKILVAARKAYMVHAQTGLPEENEIVELHKIRNRIQHGAIIPDLSTVERFKRSTENFISIVFDKAFSKTLQQVSLGSLIHDQELRALVQRAERHFDDREFRKCIEVCDDALIKATFDTGDVIGKAGMLTGYWGTKMVRKMIDRNEYVSRYRGPAKKLAQEFSEAILELGRIATSMQFLDSYRGDFLHHREIVNRLDRLSESKLKDGATSSLGFVTNLILKWQVEGILGQRI
jgi:hypothetical protein